MQASGSAAGSKRIRALADVVVGVGVHAMLFSWLCLVEGMRYHTAEAVTQRGKKQREIGKSTRGVLGAKRRVPFTRT